ncbi:DinB family protein [Paenibacillus sp. ACRRX]|uniref:DinB family protein n=1 Tax=Paenibacillus sp. ACRRX TaxID=2918206 RepID=UPI001EF63E55|nr:DinB family protein [Paenibacillus sp. ACRRX]MCG7409260.1 DinB family protein [Paenibacillus sp. ACRRX]
MSQLAFDMESYLSTYGKLKQAIEGLTDEELTWKAAPHQWSVTEVLAHLVDHSVIVSFRIREILSGSDVRLPFFSQDPWVAGQKANDGAAADALQVFKALLEYHSLLLQRLTPDDWSKTGINWKDESISLATVIQAFITHVETHLAQIARIKLGNSEARNSSCTF